MNRKIWGGEDEENFISESFTDVQENSEKPENKNDKNEGFLQVIDFFNYKPIDDYPQTRQRKKICKNPKGIKVLFSQKYSIQEVIKVIRWS